MKYVKTEGAVPYQGNENQPMPGSPSGSLENKLLYFADTP